MPDKKFETIVKECELFLDKNITIKVQLCPDCEFEVSEYNSNYLCPNCGCLKISCTIREITINKLNNDIKNKKFEYIGVRDSNIEYLNELGKEGWEICGNIEKNYHIIIYLKREIID